MLAGRVCGMTLKGNHRIAGAAGGRPGMGSQLALEWDRNAGAVGSLTRRGGAAARPARMDQPVTRRTETGPAGHGPVTVRDRRAVASAATEFSFSSHQRCNWPLPPPSLRLRARPGWAGPLPATGMMSHQRRSRQNDSDIVTVSDQWPRPADSERRHVTSLDDLQLQVDLLLLVLLVSGLPVTVARPGARGHWCH